MPTFFSVQGSWRLLLSFSLLLAPLAIAMSRTADYHHHWSVDSVSVNVGLYVCVTLFQKTSLELDRILLIICVPLSFSVPLYNKEIRKSSLLLCLCKLGGLD